MAEDSKVSVATNETSEEVKKDAEKKEEPKEKVKKGHKTVYVILMACAYAVMLTWNGYSTLLNFALWLHVVHLIAFAICAFGAWRLFEGTKEEKECKKMEKWGVSTLIFAISLVLTLFLTAIQGGYWFYNWLLW